MHLAASNSGGGSGWLTIAMFGLLIVGMWFILIRPQQRRRREAEQMQSSLSVGAEVVTVGGLYGTVKAIEDDSVTLEVAPGLTNRYVRSAIGRVLTQREPAEERLNREDGETSGEKDNGPKSAVEQSD